MAGSLAWPVGVLVFVFVLKGEIAAVDVEFVNLELDTVQEQLRRSGPIAARPSVTAISSAAGVGVGKTGRDSDVDLRRR